MKLTSSFGVWTAASIESCPSRRYSCCQPEAESVATELLAVVRPIVCRAQEGLTFGSLDAGDEMAAVERLVLDLQLTIAGDLGRRVLHNGIVELGNAGGGRTVEVRPHVCHLHIAVWFVVAQVGLGRLRREDIHVALLSCVSS